MYLQKKIRNGIITLGIAGASFSFLGMIDYGVTNFVFGKSYPENRDLERMSEIEREVFSFYNSHEKDSLYQKWRNVSFSELEKIFDTQLSLKKKYDSLKALPEVQKIRKQNQAIYDDNKNNGLYFFSSCMLSLFLTGFTGIFTDPFSIREKRNKK